MSKEAEGVTKIMMYKPNELKAHDAVFIKGGRCLAGTPAALE